MNRRTIGWLICLGVFFSVLLLCPQVVFAYEFQAKTQALTSNLISTVLPLLSTLGLLYASILALTGDGGAKARVFGVIFASIVGFLAPYFIVWLKAAAGS